MRINLIILLLSSCSSLVIAIETNPLTPSSTQTLGLSSDCSENAKRNSTREFEAQLSWFSRRLREFFSQEYHSALSIERIADSLSDNLERSWDYGWRQMYRNDILLKQFHFIKDVLLGLQTSAQVMLYYNSGRYGDHVLLRNMAAINVKLWSLRLKVNEPGCNLFAVQDILRWCLVDMLRFRLEYESLEPVPAHTWQSFRIQVIQAEQNSKIVRDVLEERRNGETSKTSLV